MDGVAYRGVFVRQWDPGTLSDMMTFSALSDTGTAVWGSHAAR
ncbi:glycoside hydrolase family 43 C-terminal domain-containing protein [Cohnella lubricantis]|nr:glycoside hydrolase family 43 C-terminal domain-containing protein [Cohnella lubricantis]MBP2118181.1 beta-xylosidase [Cohnella lubricantis]